jgi:hypothetical protein
MNEDLADLPLHGPLPMHRVRLIRRFEEYFSESNPSAFARLSPGLVTVLVQDALGQAHARLNEGKNVHSGWNVLSSDGSDSVEFLPLAISLDFERTIYASYNGGEANYDDSGKLNCRYDLQLASQ